MFDRNASNSGLKRGACAVMEGLIWQDDDGLPLSYHPDHGSILSVGCISWILTRSNMKLHTSIFRTEILSYCNIALLYSHPKEDYEVLELFSLN